MKIKRDLYEKQGVRKYWIVHPTDKTFMIYCLEQNKQYARDEICAGRILLNLQ